MPTELPCLDYGSGDPALVFLHNFGGSGREWTEVIDALAARRRCIAPDLPGFGDAHGFAHHTIEAMAHEVAETLRAKNVNRFILVGHSMGGKVAMFLAMQRPRDAERLILVAPAPPGPMPMEESDRKQRLHEQPDRGTAEQTISQLTAHPLPPNLRERAVEDVLRTSDAAYRAWLEEGSREDLSKAVGILHLPALVLVGAEDPVLPAPIQNQLVLPHLSHGKLEIVPDCGHLMPLEAPAGLAARITAFLDGDNRSFL